MNVDEKDFLRIEAEYNLYQLTIEDVPYWMYSRYVFWTDYICSNVYGTAPIDNKAKLSIRSILSAVAQLLVSEKKLCSNSIVNKDICILSHSRRIKEDSYYRCVYTEPFADKYASSVILERPYERNHLRPVRHDSNLIYLDGIILESLIYYCLHCTLKTHRYKRVLDEVKRQLSEAMDDISAAYKCKIPLNKLYKMVVKKIFICKVQQKRLEKIISKINPKVIIEVVSYGSSCMMVNRIAFQKEIPTVELQHGAINPHHVGYMYNSQMKLPELPSKILVFSEFWRDYIRMPIGEENIIPVGFPYFEQNLKQYPKKQSTDKMQKILFISQTTIGVQLSQFASEVYYLIDRARFQVIYKLHPGEYKMWREKYPWLASCGIDVVDNNTKSLYELFSECDIQVGVYSTALYEGLGYNLHTFIYNTAFADAVSCLISSGYATLVDDSRQFLEYLDRLSDSKKKSSQLFWASESVANICKVIDECLIQKRNGRNE